MDLDSSIADAKPNTTPLYLGRAIVVDEIQRKLDIAREEYRRAYDRGYLLSERGDYEKAQAILDAANQKLREAEWDYAAARGTI